MSTKAGSISISQLSTVAHKAAKAALEKAELRNVAPEPGLIYHYPWIMGIVFRDPDLALAAKYQQVAEHVTSKVNEAAINPQPLPPGESSALYFFDHIIILGFILDPQAPVRLVD